MSLLLALACSSPAPPAPVDEPTPPPEPAVPLEEVGQRCYAEANEGPVPTGLTSVGSFSQVRATEDHAYGHGFDLMRHGDACVGLYMLWEGNIGAHFGVIEDLSCPNAEGRVSFEVGSIWWLGYSDPGPYKADLHFEGKLQGDTLAGTVVHRDEKTPFEATREDVPLDIRWGQHVQLSAATTCVGDRVRER